MTGRKAGAALLSMLMLVGLLSVMPPLAGAAPKLMVYDVELSAEPAIQGPDLPIIISAKVGCGGACCYVVYGTNLRATISLPGNFSLNREVSDWNQSLTSPGFEPGTVAAQPGGGLTWITVKWEVNASSYGTFPINVTVTGTNDAGDSLHMTSSINVNIASGAAISSPIFPHRPVVGKETKILVHVSSRKEVRSVYLNMSRDNRTWAKMPMSLISGDLYSAAIPALSSEGKYYFSMESIDSADDHFSTPPYTMDVRDPDRIVAISGGATLFVTAGSLLGMALILYFGSRRVSSFRSKGLFLVGDAKMEAALREREAMKDAQGRMIALRWKLLAALSVITLVLFVISLITGQLQSVIRHTTNPSEALIWLGR